MLINLHTQDKKGRELYRNALTGMVAPLNQQDFYPSQRADKRDSMGLKKKVSSTKKSKNAKKVQSKIGKFFTLLFDKKIKKVINN